MMRTLYLEESVDDMLTKQELPYYACCPHLRMLIATAFSESGHDAKNADCTVPN